MRQGSINRGMSARFVHTSQISPPPGRTVMVRSGGLVSAAALRQFSGWALIHGCGEISNANPPNGGWMTVGRTKRD